ncbi:hypothetical protein FBULB1_2576 [Fusarium bulbicola]|nr:hypothetical protein FBULB1_2576 [Fusarium bulbicola]
MLRMEPVANQVAAHEAEEVEDLGSWTVVPGGEVMLVGARKVQILVSASFLSHVSVMFEKMFSGGMKEGNSLTNRVDGQQARIELIDDNPEATYHALKILYGSDPGSFKLPPRTIRYVSIFADKADMVQRFKPICSLWLETAPGSVDKPSIQAGFDLLVASYWFDHGEGFFIMSQFFVRTDIPLLEFALELGDEPLGLRLALAIEELRLANAYRNETIGLCLDCFVAATKTLVAQQPGCRQTRRHLVL